MKFFSSLFLSLVFLGLQSCSPKIQPPSAEVNYLYREAQGTIGVQSVGYGSDRFSAVKDAQKNAFRVLLFRGLPGTELNVPLVENEYEALAARKAYFDRFFEGEQYRSFMMSSTETGEPVRQNRRTRVIVDLKINYNSLRKDLEQQSVIRKFGY